MKRAVLRGVTDIGVRLYVAIAEFAREVNNAVELRNRLRHIPPSAFPVHVWEEVRSGTAGPFVVYIKTFLWVTFFDQHKRFKHVQDLFVEVVRLRGAMETKAARAGIPVDRVYRGLFAAGTLADPETARAVLGAVSVLQYLLEKDPLLVRMDANKKLVTPDFRFLKRVVVPMFQDGGSRTIHALVKARKEWKKRVRTKFD